MDACTVSEGRFSVKRCPCVRVYTSDGCYRQAPAANSLDELLDWACAPCLLARRPARLLGGLPAC